MSEAAERAKVGEERAGRACAWCKAALGAEEDAAICAECGVIHHETCWDGQLGCAGAGCFNAPLKRLDAPEPGQATAGKAKSGKPKTSKPKRRANVKLCVDCAAEMPLDEQICDECNAINTPDGLYHGPKITAPGASEALVMSLVGIFLCAPILGPMAISRGLKAREAISKDPRLSGGGMATAGLVIGILSLVLWVVGYFGKAAGLGK